MDSAGLVQVAAAAGYRATLRMLETFRNQSLLPRTKRTGYHGRIPIWTYPTGADQQLLTLLHRRQHTKDPNVLRVWLWLDGFPVPTSTVRESLVDNLQTGHALLEEQIANHTEQHDADRQQPDRRAEALRILAGQLAAKRGSTALPRHRRATTADRAHAIELILRAHILGERLHPTTRDAATLQKVLVPPHHSPPRTKPAAPPIETALLEAGGITSLPDLIDAARTATETDLDTTRRLIVTACRRLP